MMLDLNLHNEVKASEKMKNYEKKVSYGIKSRERESSK